MINLTGDEADIGRGYRWPQRGYFTMTIESSDPFDSGEEGWTWKLLFDQAIEGGDPDISVDADTVTKVDSTHLAVKFKLSSTETRSLSGKGETRFYTDLVATDDEGEPRLWSQAFGIATVRDAVGDSL